MFCFFLKKIISNIAIAQTYSVSVTGFFFCFVEKTGGQDRQSGGNSVSSWKINTQIEQTRGNGFIGPAETLLVDPYITWCLVSQ